MMLDFSTLMLFVSLALTAVATLDCSKPVNELKMGKMWISSTNVAMSAILLLDSFLFLNVPCSSRLRQLFHKLAFAEPDFPFYPKSLMQARSWWMSEISKGVCED
jgi:hypothetical protein